MWVGNVKNGNRCGILQIIFPPVFESFGDIKLCPSSVCLFLSFGKELLWAAFVGWSDDWSVVGKKCGKCGN